MHFVIIGASRGLGAAMVDECLKLSDAFVIGLGRSEKREIENISQWELSGRFRYHQVDVACEECRAVLEDICKVLPSEPVCVIFNAALLDPDVSDDGDLVYDTYHATSMVVVVNFGHVLDVFGSHLRRNNGIVVGISSTIVLAPLVQEKMLAYPASKAYLTAALRSLRMLWRDQVRIMTVLLGHVGNKKFRKMPSWIVPSYETTAKKIITATQREFVPSRLFYPYATAAAYRLLGLVPDRISSVIFRRIRILLRFAMMLSMTLDMIECGELLDFCDMLECEEMM